MSINIEACMRTNMKFIYIDNLGVQVTLWQISWKKLNLMKKKNLIYLKKINKCFEDIKM